MPALLLLCTLSTENEAKDLLNEAAFTHLVAYFGQSVRHELHREGRLWALRGRAMVIRTLEQMATSDEGVVGTLVRLDVLPLLWKVLDAHGATQEELSAALACLWTISYDSDALRHIAHDQWLVKGLFLKFCKMYSYMYEYILVNTVLYKWNTVLLSIIINQDIL